MRVSIISVNTFRLSLHRVCACAAGELITKNCHLYVESVASVVSWLVVFGTLIRMGQLFLYIFHSV